MNERQEREILPFLELLRSPMGFEIIVESIVISADGVY